MLTTGELFFVAVKNDGTYMNNKGEVIQKWKAWFSETNVIGNTEIICVEVSDYICKNAGLADQEKGTAFFCTLDLSGRIYEKNGIRGHFNTVKLKEIRKADGTVQATNNIAPIDDLPF